MRTKRLGIRAAREIARLIQQQEQQEQFIGVELPEEWVPFYFDEEEAEPEQGDGDEEQEKEEQQPEESGNEQGAPVQFGSYLKKFGDKGTPLYLRSFSSVRDFCEQPFANERNATLSEAVHGDGRGGFADREIDEEVKMSNEEWYGGTRNANEAAARAFKGWPEGAERVRKMMDDVEAPPPVSLRRKTQRADQGDEIDIHEVYRGGLDRAWSRRRRQTTRSRMSVRIVARLGANKYAQWEKMFWRGAAAAKLAELLEESSYRVEIIGASAVAVNCHADENSGSTMAHWPSTLSTFVIKEAGSPIDLEQLAGVLCNAGFFRTHSFRAAFACCGETIGNPHRYEVEEVVWRRVVKTGKYKTTQILYMGLSASECVEAAELKSDGTLTFVVPSGISSAQQAQEWVVKCIAALEGGEEQGSAQDD